MSKDYKLDKTDLEIVRNLWDGRTPYKDIADKIGLTTNTVRNRVNRLLEKGVLQIISLVDVSAIEGHNSAIIGFKVRPRAAKDCLKKISALKGVIGASRVSGRFDVMAVMMYNKEFTFENFLENEVASVEDILSMETFFYIDGEKFQLRYVL